MLAEGAKARGKKCIRQNAWIPELYRHYLVSGSMMFILWKGTIMKIAVIGASGKEGRLLVREAIARGHEVTAIVRDKSKIAEPKAAVLEKDLFALTYDDIKNNDVIIDAFGAYAPEDLDKHYTSLIHLAGLLSGRPNRLLVVGGAGSLYVNPEHTVRVMDTPDFPEAFKPLANAMVKAFDALRVKTDVKWTYLSPSAMFYADGNRTGKYVVGGEELLANSKGESRISYADYAIAMIDEAESGKHVNARFTVVGE